MYAVIETGGKQYRVQTGDFIQVEKLEGEVGSSFKFEQILLLSETVDGSPKIVLGKPYVAGAKVEGEFVGQGRGEKILIVKMKRRKQYRRTQGHRQDYSQLMVTSITSASGETVSLNAEEKTQKLGKFQSHLKAKGPASTAPTLGSRVRLAKARAQAQSEKKVS
jgi:large subunit ribosomal protein L21